MTWLIIVELRVKFTFHVMIILTILFLFSRNIRMISLQSTYMYLIYVRHCFDKDCDQETRPGESLYFVKQV